MYCSAADSATVRDFLSGPSSDSVTVVTTLELCHTKGILIAGTSHGAIRLFEWPLAPGAGSHDAPDYAEYAFTPRRAFFDSYA